MLYLNLPKYLMANILWWIAIKNILNHLYVHIFDSTHDKFDVLNGLYISTTNQGLAMDLSYLTVGLIPYTVEALFS